MHPIDNVVVALTDLLANQQYFLDGMAYTPSTDVKAKHKFTTEPLSIGDNIIMYGVLVGKATQAIDKGAVITIFNVAHAASHFTGKTKEVDWQVPDVTNFKERTFLGYHRSDGRVGTANYWLVVPTVFCENRNLEIMREAINQALGYTKSNPYQAFAHKVALSLQSGSPIEAFPLNPESQALFPNVDGVQFLIHQGGCGGTRQDSAILARLLADYIDHPNVAGATVMSLGCEHLHIDEMKALLTELNPNFDKPVLYFGQQDMGNEEELLKAAIANTIQGIAEANKIKRQPASLAKLVLGVKCGGSDGFSGISANPALGYTSDLIVALGGQVLLAEFPELNGVEQELADRCTDAAKADKFVSLMQTYGAKAEALGSGFHMNPSPGNIKDGLITDAIKSAGAAKKGGTSPIVDVLDYTERATKPGLNLVCTPGNDVEATTGKVAAGATLIVFTTGLGTPTGNPICPVIKASTNHTLAERMAGIIDFDCGDIVTGLKTIEQVGTELLDYCISVASGQAITKATALGQADFIPWKRGISL